MSPDGKLGWTEDRSRGAEKHAPENTAVVPSSSRQYLLYFAKPKENNSCLAPLIPASIHARLCPGLQGFLLLLLSL